MRLAPTCVGPLWFRSTSLLLDIPPGPFRPEKRHHMWRPALDLFGQYDSEYRLQTVSFGLRSEWALAPCTPPFEVSSGWKRGLLTSPWTRSRSYGPDGCTLGTDLMSCASGFDPTSSALPGSKRGTSPELAGWTRSTQKLALWRTCHFCTLEPWWRKDWSHRSANPKFCNNFVDSWLESRYQFHFRSNQVSLSNLLRNTSPRQAT